MLWLWNVQTEHEDEFQVQTDRYLCFQCLRYGEGRGVARCNMNSSGDEIANVNFYAVRPEATRIR